MRVRSRWFTGALSVAVLTGGQLAVATSGSGADPGDRGRSAVERLRADAVDAVTLVGRPGAVSFVGTPAGGGIDNPRVGGGTTVAAAAREHLDRYGSALGADRAGTHLAPTSQVRTATGQDAVRYRQEVGGLPVLGGEVVVSLRPGGDLASMLSTMSTSTGVPEARVGEATAADAALAAAQGSSRRGGLQVAGKGRWLFDAALLGARTEHGARGVWRFEVGNGADVRRLVLVDDLTGAVVMDVDQVAHALDRIVCDNNNVQRADAVPCTAPIRSEGEAAVGLTDANLAFDYSGDVSEMYADLGIDLTALVGKDVSGVKKLASTVRWCFTGSGGCDPYADAFWNGTEMYYGAGYASADDVVGHEITHGVIQRNADLLYWGQSGAINESLADIMGEIMDHRNGAGTDAAGNWQLGEDLPPAVGALRDLKNPPAFQQPDKMTSGLYTSDIADEYYRDRGGVHTNSGVGNKTAYLISQGGTFNGQTVTGIDGADAGLTKTARLYLAAIQGLTSGSDYADLARVLDQSCQDLVGTHGFTATDCAEVHQAGVATELTTTPPKAPQRADASVACPAGNVRRVLFSSETGTPTDKLVPSTQDGTWSRAPGDYPGNATSGKDSWFAFDSPSIRTSSLVTAAPVVLPAGKKSYLSFNGWYVQDWFDGAYQDGGTVEVDDLGTPAEPLDAAAMPWVNGPNRTLSQFQAVPQPHAGKKAFGGDSFGWVRSRLDLSSLAGRSVKPQFTQRSDGQYAVYGWYLDDIEVYTCEPGTLVAPAPTIRGVAKVRKVLTAVPGTWRPAGVLLTYQWFRGAKAIPGARGRTYKVKPADRGKKLKVRVTGTKTGHTTKVVLSRPTKKVRR